ncbi:uncharacterized protein LOC107366924 [Tetranychus urticae]|uniref:Uncharacterized protein n=1 Tax=Tetranychus urticae TaxID=32264 RepID=T1KTE7_TETUR|nr:uncharacterized protein LOC107366924 [Tetranychus urticae]
MVRHLVLLSCLLLIPAAVVLAKNGGLNEPIPLILWASSDPAEDQEAGRINPVKFYHFIEDNLEAIMDYHNRSDAVGISLYLANHGEESGTEGTLWAAVFAKIAFKKTIGETVEKEHGLPSLVAWAITNTGTGSSNPSIDRSTLVEFILYHKTAILKLLSKGDVDGLVAYLNETKSESGTKNLDWKSVIENLRDNRQLFKYSCGLFGLQLCDRIKN